MNRSELNKLFKWVPGHKMTTRDWMNLLRDSSNKDANNLFFAMKHGLETGRLPNWTKNADGVFFTNSDGSKMTNSQQRMVVVSAMMNQETRTTAAGLKALQESFGLKVF